MGLMGQMLGQGPKGGGGGRAEPAKLNITSNDFQTGQLY